MNAQQHREIEKLYFSLYEQMLAYARCSLKNEAIAEEVNCPSLYGQHKKAPM